MPLTPHKIDKKSFKEELFNFIQDLKGSENSIYLDGKALPTIGIGYLSDGCGDSFTRHHGQRRRSKRLNNMKFFTLFFISMFFINMQAQEFGPGFDCTKAKTKMEKTICNDKSGSLQMLDKQLSKIYTQTMKEYKRSNLQDKDIRINSLLQSQRNFIKAAQKIDDYYKLKAFYEQRNAEILKIFDQISTQYGNTWSGKYALSKGLYSGLFTLENCDDNGCDVSYEAYNDNALNSCEFGDEWNFKIKDKNTAILTNTDEYFKDCQIRVELLQNGIIFHYENFAQKCYAACGHNALMQPNEIYIKE